MYTHDKDIITQSLSATIFICVPNDKNRIHVQEGEGKSWDEEQKQPGGVGTDGKGASSKKSPVSEHDGTL